MPRESLSDALFVDLYELTMAQAYLRSGHTAPATFSLFVRNLPPDRGYMLFAGLEDVLRHLTELRFTAGDLDRVRSAGKFDDDLIDHLSGFRFTGGVRAMPEGTPFFADEPVLEVTAPVIEAQIVETYLLNQVNMQSLFATKAARIARAAGGAAVVDFAARRTHGADAADKFARSSYIGGFAGTSNVRAAARYGIPAAGTMAHSFVTSFGSELEAFRAYAGAFPDSTTLLVDTYDTAGGVAAAMTVAREMEERGERLAAIRLDSGDLDALARMARRMLDDAGLTYVQIVASGGLDEFAIDRLVRAGVPVNAFGVGTKAGVSADAPWSDAAYKQVAYDGIAVAKLSAGKETLPGAKQVWRTFGADGRVAGDYLTAADAAPPAAGATPLLGEVMRDGEVVVELPSLKEIRRRAQSELGRLPEPALMISGPTPVPVSVARELTAGRPGSRGPRPGPDLRCHDGARPSSGPSLRSSGRTAGR